MTSAGPILVVDDQAKNLVALRTVLEPLGRPVVTATSGEDALKRLLTEDFAVIVMDVRMPGMDGLDATKALLEREPNTSVLIFTAYSERSLLARGLELRERGANDKRTYRVHDKLAEPCFVCGAPIARVDFEEHTIYYCPHCQTGDRVLKDRRLSKLLR